MQHASLFLFFNCFALDVATMRAIFNPLPVAAGVQFRVLPPQKLINFECLIFDFDLWSIVFSKNEIEKNKLRKNEIDEKKYWRTNGTSTFQNQMHISKQMFTAALRYRYRFCFALVC